MPTRTLARLGGGPGGLGWHRAQGQGAATRAGKPPSSGALTQEGRSCQPGLARPLDGPGSASSTGSPSLVVHTQVHPHSLCARSGVGTH